MVFNKWKASEVFADGAGQFVDSLMFNPLFA
jgi:hypothetical protein